MKVVEGIDHFSVRPWHKPRNSHSETQADFDKCPLRLFRNINVTKLLCFYGKTRTSAIAGHVISPYPHTNCVVFKNVCA